MLYSAILDVDAERAFDAGCKAAAVTHGHPTGYLAAGFLALLIYMIMQGAQLQEAVRAALEILQTRSDHRETSDAVSNALALARTHPDPSPEVVERLGGGWIAEEALAIAIYCSLVASGEFTRGVLVAVNHGGDSDSTAP